MTNNKKQYTRVLTIAGSDSGGGAGIQADLKTIAANGCYGMSVITALTAQNTQGVSGIFPVPVDFVQQQLKAVLGDIGGDAIKIGMLFSPELITAVGTQLRQSTTAPIVLDPVMVAQSGDKLLKQEAVAALKRELIPYVEVLTPNLPEASVLLEKDITTFDEMEQAAIALSELGCANVLLKGGHLQEDICNDLLYLGKEKRTVVLSGRRIPTNNNHGTGCTLASAVAAHLALGKTIEAAVAAAKEYLTGALESGAGYTIGKGHGPVDHFYRFFPSS